MTQRNPKDPGGAAAATASPPGKPPASRPPAEADRLADEARRRFLNRLTLGMAAVGGAVIGAPIAGFVVGPMLKNTERVWYTVGIKSDFEIGTTSLVFFEDPSPLPWAGVTARTAAYLRRESEDGFIAFAVNCTHLGCPVRWLEEAGLFMCPCHGGVYYRDGNVAAGPPPLPLRRYAVRVDGNAVQLETSPLPTTVG